MNRLLLFFVLTSLLLSACYRPAPKQAFEDLKAIEGRWTSVEGTQFNETWQLENDSLLTGIGFSLQGKDTAFKEILKISREGDEVTYGALVAENDGFVLFRLKDPEKDCWRFVNPEHDYPNIIEYRLVSDTVLEARTMNMRGNKEIKFVYKRVRE